MRSKEEQFESLLERILGASGLNFGVLGVFLGSSRILRGILGISWGFLWGSLMCPWVDSTWSVENGRCSASINSPWELRIDKNIAQVGGLLGGQKENSFKSIPTLTVCQVLQPYIAKSPPCFNQFPMKCTSVSVHCAAPPLSKQVAKQMQQSFQNCPTC